MPLIAETDFDRPQRDVEPNCSGMLEKGVVGSSSLKIEETDMDIKMVDKSLEIIADAFRRYTHEKDLASFIKEEFERNFGTTWHCVVGKSFGSRISYEIQHFMLLKYQRISVMIYKCGY